MREQRGGYLNVRYATLISRRGKSRYVADDTTTERNNRRCPVASRRQHGVENTVQRLPCLVLLAIGQFDCKHIDVRVAQTCFKSLKKKWRDRLIGYDHDPVASQMCSDEFAVIQNAVSDNNRIASGTKADLEGSRLHCLLLCRVSRLRLMRDQLRLEAVYQRMQAGTAGLDYQVGNIPVERITLLKNGIDACLRVARLQQRPILVVPRTIDQFTYRGTQIHDSAALTEQAPVLRIEYRSPASGQHNIVVLGQFPNDRPFTSTETFFALDIENNGYAHPRSLLDNVVGIVESLAQPSCQNPADGGLSRPHHPHQENIAGNVD